LTRAKPHRGVFEDARRTGVWWIHYYDAAGKRHREKIGAHQDAIDAYIERKVQIRGGTFTPPGRKDQIGFKQLMEEALNYKKLRIAPRSYVTDRERSKLLLEMFGGVRAQQVTPQLIELKFQRFLGTDISGSTVNRYRSLLSSIFSYAVRMGKLPANPVARFQRYKENEHRVRFLAADEETALRKAIVARDPRLEPLFELALYTGIRRGEQFSLQWQNIDLGRGIVTVTGKTGRRFVPVNTGARAAIEKLYAASNGSAFVCPAAKRLGQRDWSRWFEDCAREAKIDNFTWHDLRHTFASRLVMEGVDLSTVQKLLGHRSIVTTMRYAHLAPTHLQAAVERLCAKPTPTAIKQPSAARRLKRTAGKVI